MSRVASVGLLVAACVVLLAGCGRLAYESRSSGLDDKDAGPTCGDGIVSGAERCDDGNTIGGDGCSADCSDSLLCGDGNVDPGEACDDGNGTAGDGCESDCTASCETANVCADGDLCNGDESCNAGACRAGVLAVDGTDCGGGSRCRAGTCAPSTCGDGDLQAGEDCDDANIIAGDGCENDCSFSCEVDADCSDGNPCNGAETCRSSNVCNAMAAIPVEGSACERDGDESTRDVCVGSDCVRSICGDGFVDSGAEPPEACDDANEAPGDGCNNDCKPSCSIHEDCDDGKLCNGAEMCNLVDGACHDAPDLPDGTPCGSGFVCMSGVCITPTSDAGTGADTDAGACPTSPLPTSPLLCFQDCAIDADCTLVDECCCGCANGGTSHSINSRHLLIWNQRRLLMCPDCGGIGCLSVFQCTAPASCSAGKCVGGGPGAAAPPADPPGNRGVG